MTRVLVRIYKYTKHLDGSEDRVLYQAFDREFENGNEAREWSNRYCLDMSGNYGDEVISYTYKLSDHEDDLELCDFFDKCLKYAVNMVAENPRYASLYNDDISSPEELQEKLEEFYNGEESEQYWLGYDDGKKFYESSSPFEKRNIEWKSEEYQKGFNDGFNTTLNRECFDGI